MKKQIVWLLVSGLMVLSLVLASCAPATPTTPTPPTTPTTPTTPTPPPTTTTPTTESPKTPKYGGQFIDFLTETPLGFDEGNNMASRIHSHSLTNDELLEGDWAKGPAGTGEASFSAGLFMPQFTTGCLAESWEFPDPNTIVFHIRKGVHFGLNPNSEASRLVNGRELTADDVVASLTRILKMPASHVGSAAGAWFKSATATDKYTAVFKGQDSELYPTAKIFEFLTEEHHIMPREVLEKYGDTRDWRNVVGTGPFILTEYVSGSSLSFVKNPNYWEKDPVGPGKGNQLPYIDSAKWLVITDKSTRLAALRTGKVDWMNTITVDDSEMLRKSNPELQWKRSIMLPVAMFMRTDVKPFDDIRVRRALSMSVDREEITRDFYRGDAEAFVIPITTEPEFKSMYTPIAELPPSQKEVVTYNPDKAKQLLTQAGYPNGFKFTVVVPTPYLDWTDRMLIFKEFFAKIGVEMTLDLKDYAIWSSMRNGHKYTYAVVSNYSSQASTYLIRYFTPPGASYNYSIVDDPVLNAAGAKIWSLENYTNQPVRDKAVKDYVLHLIDQAYYVDFPSPYEYTFWWPWLNNFYGLDSNGPSAFHRPTKYNWIDQDLKKSMGY